MGNRWAAIPLGTVGKWYGGSTPSKARADFWTDGLIPWVSPKDMKTLRISDSEDRITSLALQERNQSVVPIGSVLVVIRSGILSRTLPVATTTCKVTINQDLKALEPCEGVNSEFTAWFMRSEERKILNECSKDGTTVASVNLEALKSVEMPLPSRVEQRAIVAKIESLFSELDAGVAQLEAVKAQLERYRQSVLKAAFEGKLTAEWREARRCEAEAKGETLPTADDLLEQIRAEREAHAAAQLKAWQRDVKAWEEAGGKDSGEKKPRKPKALKDPPPLTGEELAELPELPEGWVWSRLESIVEPPQYGTSKKCVNDKHGRSVLRIPNMGVGRIDAADLKYAEFTPNEAAAYELKPGDVLIIRSNGSVSLVGRPALITESDTEHLFAGYLIRLRPRTATMSGVYLTQCLLSHELRVQIETQARSTSGVNNINSSEINGLLVPVCGADEQSEILHEIDSRMSILDNVELGINASREQSTALRQSILKQAFEGRLLTDGELEAVRADPDYEPAEALLARIRAEREATPAKPKRRNKTTKRAKSAAKEQA